MYSSHGTVSESPKRYWSNRLWREGAKERDDFGQTHWLNKTSKVAAKHSCGLIKINTYHPRPPKNPILKQKAYWMKRAEEGEVPKFSDYVNRVKIIYIYILKWTILEIRILENIFFNFYLYGHVIVSSIVCIVYCQNELRDWNDKSCSPLTHCEYMANDINVWKACKRAVFDRSSNFKSQQQFVYQPQTKSSSTFICLRM